MSPLPTNIIQETIDLFWETVPPVWNTVRSHIRAIAARQFDITEEQFHILRHIHKGVHSVSELAEVRRISRPAISQGVDALVNKGLIRRQQSTDDRRYIHLELTEDGNALMDQVFELARLWMKSRLSTVSAEDLQTTRAGLVILKEAICEQTS